MIYRSKCFFLQHSFMWIKHENLEDLSVIWLKRIWLNKETLNILKKVIKIIQSLLFVPLYQYLHNQVVAQGGGTVPTGNMKHARYTSNNYGELPAAVVSRRGLFLEPDSSGVSRFMWSLFFWEFWNIISHSHYLLKWCMVGSHLIIWPINNNENTYK
jgi:hypothetical protein